MSDTPLGEQVVTENEDLYRQVNPGFVEVDGTISSQAFKPTIKDESCLSVSRSTVIDAKLAYQQFVEKGYRSAGSWLLTVDDATAVGCQVIDDSQVEGQTVPEGHAFVDFRHLGRAAADKVGKQLRNKAASRGWAYSPV